MFLPLCLVLYLKMSKKTKNNVSDINLCPTDEELERMSKAGLTELYSRLMARKKQINKEFRLERSKRKLLIKIKHLIEQEIDIRECDSGLDEEGEEEEEPRKLFTGQELSTEEIAKIFQERFNQAQLRYRHDGDVQDVNNINDNLDNINQEHVDGVKPKIEVKTENVQSQVKQEIKQEIKREIESEPGIKRKIKNEFEDNKKIKIEPE